MKDLFPGQFASEARIWVAHASRVLVSASRRNNLSTKCPAARSGALRKVRESATLSPRRETRALPGNGCIRGWARAAQPHVPARPKMLRRSIFLHRLCLPKN